MAVQLTKDNIFLPHYRGRLTEGITYNAANNTLLWIDIIAAEVHRVSLDDASVRTHETLKFDDAAESVGAIALTKDNDVVLVCAKHGVAKGNFSTGTIEYFLKYPHDTTRLRSNDGIVDPWGHLWIGVMTDFPFTAKEGTVSPEGKLYRINSDDLSVEVMLDAGVLIPNGLSFSHDGTQLFWTDSLTFTIWQFDYNHATNTLSNKRPFVESKALFPNVESPEPDGLTLTTHNELYSTVFHTGAVIHVDSQGQLVEQFNVPAIRVSCVTIGGPNDNELFVTTAHENLADFSAKIDAGKTTGDLGGFLFKVTSDKPLHGKHKGIWGGKV